MSKLLPIATDEIISNTYTVTGCYRWIRLVTPLLTPQTPTDKELIDCVTGVTNNLIKVYNNRKKYTYVTYIRIYREKV